MGELERASRRHVAGARGTVYRLPLDHEVARASVPPVEAPHRAEDRGIAAAPDRAHDRGRGLALVRAEGAAMPGTIHVARERFE
jgi:hypothetical protein